jgi:hypothetical protein
MEGYIVHGGIGLARGSAARLEDARGLAIEVWDGELWITQAGDRRDYFVRPGERFVVNRDGVVLAQALRPSHATLTAAVPACYARRITVMAADGRSTRVIYDRSCETVGWLAGLGYRLARAWVNAYAARSYPTTAAL